MATPRTTYSLITQNRSAELRTQGFFELGLRVIGVWAALPFGVVAVAASFSATTVIVVLIRIIVAGRTGPVTFRDHLVATAPAVPLVLGALIGCGFGALAATTLVLPPLPAVTAICLGGGIMGCALGLASGSSRRGLIELAAIVRGHPA